jgi:hypothetical protein
MMEYQGRWILKKECEAVDQIKVGETRQWKYVFRNDWNILGYNLAIIKAVHSLQTWSLAWY